MKLAVVLVAFGAMIGLQPSRRAAELRFRPELLIQLSVSDLDPAIGFYTDVLGFELTERRDDLRFAHLDTFQAVRSVSTRSPSRRGPAARC